MNAVDLARFQFDYYQTWAVVFMNADGTIYGRYGTRAGNRDRSTTHISVAGLARCMERVLQVHRNYPSNRAALAGKQPRAVPVRAAEQFPWLKRRVAQSDPAKRCVHCHMVGSSFVRWQWQRGRLTERDLFTYPLPEAVGLKMHRDDDLTVAEVREGSPAERAGLRPGDRLLSLNRQVLVSQADIQWVLHHAEDGARLPLEYVRSGRRSHGTLVLPTGRWRRGKLTWQELAWHLRPGMRVRPLDESARRRLHIGRDQMALVVDLVFRWDRRARESGVRKGDVVIEVNGRRDLLDEESFLAYLWLNHKPGETVPIKVRRGKQELDLGLPMRWHPAEY